jgi:hypothetical protein
MGPSVRSLGQGAQYRQNRWKQKVAVIEEQVLE